jgi:hypothetical protein
MFLNIVLGTLFVYLLTLYIGGTIDSLKMSKFIAKIVEHEVRKTIDDNKTEIASTFVKSETLCHYVSQPIFDAFFSAKDTDEVSPIQEELTKGFDKYLTEVVEQTAHEKYIEIYNKIYKFSSFGITVEHPFWIGYFQTLFHSFIKDRTHYIDFDELNYLTDKMNKESEGVE